MNNSLMISRETTLCIDPPAPFGPIGSTNSKDLLTQLVPLGSPFIAVIDSPSVLSMWRPIEGYDVSTLQKWSFPWWRS